MVEYTNEQPPIDRFSKHVLPVARILQRLTGAAPNLYEPEVAQSVELTDVLVGERLMDVTQTTAPRGSRANDLEKTIIAAEAPLVVVGMDTHPAYRGRTLYWVADQLGGGSVRRTVLVRNSHGNGEQDSSLVLVKSDIPLSALFGSSDPDSMTTPGVLTCDVVVRIAQPPSPDGQWDIMAQLSDRTLRGMHTDAGIELSAVMQALSESRRR